MDPGIETGRAYCMGSDDGDVETWRTQSALVRNQENLAILASWVCITIVSSRFSYQD